MYRWGSEPIRVGRWYCADHGPITPDRSGLVPACHCGRMAMVGVKSRGKVAVRVPGPRTCPNGHDLQKRGGARLSRVTCSCSLGIGHATWTCAECGELLMYPPCTRG